MNNALFPEVKRTIENLIHDEEGNIPRGKLVAIGTMIVVLSTVFSATAFAKHGSHSSHKSHSSTTYIRNHTNHASHSNHGSAHSNHGSHESHQSHTSHSNTASHSNSNYSNEAGYTSSAPVASNIKGVKAPTVNTENITYPDIRFDVASPQATIAGSIPEITMLQKTPKITAPEAKVEGVQTPPSTPQIKK